MTTTIRIETKKIALLLGDMTEMIIKNHELANKAIKNNDKNLAVEVLEKDKLVDAEFFLIESDIEFMITKAIVDKNLRRILAYLHIVTNLERIGDYAKKIAKFIIKNKKVSLSSVRRITKAQDKFQQMLEQVSQIIIEEDIKLAKKIWNLNSEVDFTTNEIRKEVIASISNKSNKKAIEERLFVLNIVNSFERACDHITNICELIQYIETGQHLNFG